LIIWLVKKIVPYSVRLIILSEKLDSLCMNYSSSLPAFFTVMGMGLLAQQNQNIDREAQQGN